MPRVALVGYTNAGKSTLFNALTGADVYAADKLFATLDPDRAPDGSAAGRRRRRWPTPSASSATCRTNWSPRSARPCRKRAMPTCCCTSSTPPTAARRAHRPGGRGAGGDRRRRHPADAGLQQDRPDRRRRCRAATSRPAPHRAGSHLRERVWLSARDAARAWTCCAARWRERFGDCAGSAASCVLAAEPGPPAGAPARAGRGARRKPATSTAGACNWTCRGRPPSGWRPSRAAICCSRSCLWPRSPLPTILTHQLKHPRGRTPRPTFTGAGMAWNSPARASRTPWSGKAVRQRHSTASLAARLRDLFGGGGGAAAAAAIRSAGPGPARPVAGLQQLHAGRPSSSAAWCCASASSTRIMTPGANFKWPWPVETRHHGRRDPDRDLTTRCRVLTRTRTSSTSSSTSSTGQRSAPVPVRLPRRLRDGRCRKAAKLQNAAESAVREQVGRSTMDTVLFERSRADRVPRASTCRNRSTPTRPAWR